MSFFGECCFFDIFVNFYSQHMFFGVAGLTKTSCWHVGIFWFKKVWFKLICNYFKVPYLPK